MYVDIHAHLDDKAFADNLAEVLQRAKQAGVRTIIANGTDLASNERVLAICEKYPVVRPAYGLYPTYETDEDATIVWIRDQAVTGAHPPVAIGEIGLDGVNEISEEQRIRFRKACALAAELRLPVIIHSRKAEQEVFDELANMRLPIPIIMHCFSGSKKLIEEGVKRRYYFSVPANINKATHFQMLVQLVPLSQLLTETDSPYLYPDAFPNEPKNVVQTIEHIARIRAVTVEECTQVLFMNYQRLFGG